MCGIIGAAAEREIQSILIEGLHKLEYRGYDSAGMVIVNHHGELSRQRVQGKVQQLDDVLREHALVGRVGMAHTRWATHGQPSAENAHPHLSGTRVAVIHNGIIENHDAIRSKLKSKGYQFTSETDSEVVAHLIHDELQPGIDIKSAVRNAINQLDGAYALGVLCHDNPHELIAVRHGAPLLLGVGFGENFFASDYLALLHVSQRVITLEDGDIATISKHSIQIYDANGKIIERPVKVINISSEVVDRGEFRHYMQKEIFEQPNALRATLANRFSGESILEEIFGANASELFDKTQQVHIIACGTSYHAGLVARYWLEGLAGLPCSVEVASEFRYRTPVVRPGTLFVAISQSGETADTLAAMRQAKTLGYVGILSICNIPESAMVQGSDLVILTKAGREIGVASTKAFTTQLTVLLLLTLVLGRRHHLSHEQEALVVKQLRELPYRVEDVLSLNDPIRELAEYFADKQHALFLGRGSQYTVALEGALKLKEISYIHAEAYPAGELKHGPLALVDKEMPVIAVAPCNALLEKLKSNLHEVRSRGGELIVFADKVAGVIAGPGTRVFEMPTVPDIIAPIVYTIPLQLLAYHVAVLKGTDVDQPRNLAKSVTVE